MAKKITLIICCIAIIVIFISIFVDKNEDKEALEKLYYTAKNMILEDSINEDKENLDTFISIKDLGYDKKEDTIYLYCWVQIEKYSKNSDGVVSLKGGSSMPYKITVENNEVISYQYPKDGSNYSKNLKELFPKRIIRKFDSIYDDSYLRENILKQVEEFYNISRHEIY